MMFFLKKKDGNDLTYDKPRVPLFSGTGALNPTRPHLVGGRVHLPSRESTRLRPPRRSSPKGTDGTRKVGQGLSSRREFTDTDRRGGKQKRRDLRLFSTYSINLRSGGVYA